MERRFSIAFLLAFVPLAAVAVAVVCALQYDAEASRTVSHHGLCISGIADPDNRIMVEDLLLGRYAVLFEGEALYPFRNGHIANRIRLFVDGECRTFWLKIVPLPAPPAFQGLKYVGTPHGNINLALYIPDGTRGGTRVNGIYLEEWSREGIPKGMGPVVAVPSGSAHAESFFLKVEAHHSQRDFIDVFVFNPALLMKSVVFRRDSLRLYLGAVISLALVSALLMIFSHATGPSAVVALGPTDTRKAGADRRSSANEPGRVIGLPLLLWVGLLLTSTTYRILDAVLPTNHVPVLFANATALRWIQYLLFFHIIIRLACEDCRVKNRRLVRYAVYFGTCLLIGGALPNVIFVSLGSIGFIDDAVILAVMLSMCFVISLAGLKAGERNARFTMISVGLFVLLSAAWEIFYRMGTTWSTIMSPALPLIRDIGILCVLLPPVAFPENRYQQGGVHVSPEASGSCTLQGYDESPGARTVAGPDDDGKEGEGRGEKEGNTRDGSALPSTSEIMERSDERQAEHLIILIVDDMPTNRRVVAQYCVRLGIQADQADSATAAVDMCRVKRYDLILMDLSLPDFEGTEAARRIKTLKTANTTTPIIGVTAGDLHRDMGSLEDTGLQDCIYKPFRLDDLLRLLKRWCPGCRL